MENASYHLQQSYDIYRRYHITYCGISQKLKIQSFSNLQPSTAVFHVIVHVPNRFIVLFLHIVIFKLL